MGNVCCSDARSKEHFSNKIVSSGDQYYAEHAPKHASAHKIDLSEMDKAVKIISGTYDNQLPDECLAFMHKLQEKIDTNKFVLGPFEYSLTNEKYMGNYKHGEREGLGITAYPDGSVYCGNYRNDQTNGQGIMVVTVDDDTNIFTGEFNRNGPHGQCLKSTASGKYRYDGKWENGKKHGYGQAVACEMTYEGNFVHDMREGFGKAWWTNNDKYTGQWCEGEPHGNGTFIWGDGREYTGSLKSGVLHGNGVHTWPEGLKKYNGDYVDGKKHGYGVFTSESGALYEGEWKEGKQHGHGKLLNAIGSLLKQGSWNKGAQIE